MQCIVILFLIPLFFQESLSQMNLCVDGEYANQKITLISISVFSFKTKIFQLVC